MKKRSLLSSALLAVVILFSAISCNKNDKGSATLSVYLTDGPADAVAVNIDVQQIAVKSSSDSGWTILPLGRAGLYNLLDFRNGLDTLLGSVQLPAGHVSQLRLILGDNNSIQVDSTTLPLPLSTPSAQQSGLKFNIDANLTDGINYKLWIDFDAGKSVVLTGDNTYILKPVIRTFTEATSGAIKGVALPKEADPWVFAISGTDTLSAMPDTATGYYLVRGVPAGTWDILIQGNNGYNDSTKTGINVVTGQVADAGTITLTK